MARFKKVLDQVLFKALNVDLQPANGAHRALLPNNTVVSKTAVTAASDWHFVHVRNRCDKLFLVAGGKVTGTPVLLSAAGTDDVFWTVPIYVSGYSTPYYNAADPHFNTLPGVDALYQMPGAEAMAYGYSPLGGIHRQPIAGAGSHYGLAMSLCVSSSQAPRIMPGFAWGMSDITAGEDLPEAGDHIGGQCELGNILAASNVSVDIVNNGVRNEVDARPIAALWLFLKGLWPVNTIVDYTGASYNADLTVRLIGLQLQG